VNIPIVGVPLTSEGWDVIWLGDKAGYLETIALPTVAGNTAITAHVFDVNNNPGPFAALDDLQYGDQVIVHAWG
jgi:sortase (surface protein transpeptidase)